MPSITATQMLASMVASPRPTRAEVSDVANAIFQGTDAVMLSEETAVGEYPVEAVRVMDRIARETEPELPYGDWVFNRVEIRRAPTSPARSPAPRSAPPTRSGLAAIVVPTRSGRTARLVSAHRPRVPVLAISPRLETVRRLNLLFGVQCEIADDWTGPHGAARRLRPAGASRPGSPSSGDLIAITAGLPAAGARHEPVRDPPGSLSSRVESRAARSAAPLALMGLIFYLSAQSERRARPARRSRA